MALIKCSECEKQISDKALACVHCGAPISVVTENSPKADGTINLEISRIDEINSNISGGWFLSITDKKGRSHLANRDVELDSEQGLSSTDLKVGDIVYFVPDYTEHGRLKKIVERLLTQEELEDIKMSIPEATHVIVTSHAGFIGDEIEGSEREITKYVIFGLVALVIGGWWLYVGAPNPSLIFASDSAKRQCLELAEENKQTSFLFDANNEIKADKTWLKKGHRVVRLIQEDGDGIKTVMCIVGRGMVQIPGFIEQGRWRN